jgi:hypothetical protein
MHFFYILSVLQTLIRRPTEKTVTLFPEPGNVCGPRSKRGGMHADPFRSAHDFLSRMLLMIASNGFFEVFCVSNSRECTRVCVCVGERMLENRLKVVGDERPPPNILHPTHHRDPFKRFAL